MARRIPKKRLLAAAILLAALVLFVLRVHPFLALDQPRPDADILVVEGWVPAYATARAAAEYQTGRYRKIYVAGLLFPPDHHLRTDRSDADITARILLAHGVPAAAIETCPADAPFFNRTSLMARAVAEKIKTDAPPPRAINVLTLGPHARQTLLAYTRLLGATAPVGVLSVPKDDYDPARWWTRRAGIKKTVKDFAGWLKELLFGHRS